MSLRIQDSDTVPEKTAEVAQAVFPKGNLYLTVFDTFGSLFADPDFAALFPDNGQPALSPVRLMLILFLQFNEGTPAWLKEIPAIRILHKVWLQNYTWKTEEQLCWRQPDELPPASVAICLTKPPPQTPRAFRRWPLSSVSSVVSAQSTDGSGFHFAMSLDPLRIV